MAVAWPVVKAALVDGLPTVVGPDVTVYDGNTVSGDSPSRYVTVAWQPATDEESAGSFEQTRTGPGGFVAEETGTVLLEVAARTGDAYLPDAFGLFDAINTWLQGNQSLGGALGAGSVVTASAEVVNAQNTAGAVQRLLVLITYFTRI